MYYAQAWHFTLFDNPLFDERIEAWMHGPVIRSIYERFKDFQVYSPLNIESIELSNIEFSQKTRDLLEDINSIYGEHTSAYLEDLTHKEDPWINARQGMPLFAKCENEITLESMKLYYSKKLNVVHAE